MQSFLELELDLPPEPFEPEHLDLFVFSLTEPSSLFLFLTTDCDPEPDFPDSEPDFPDSESDFPDAVSDFPDSLELDLEPELPLELSEPDGSLVSVALATSLFDDFEVEDEDEDELEDEGDFDCRPRSLPKYLVAALISGLL